MTRGNEYTEFFLGILAVGKDRVTVIDRDKEFCERVCDAYDVNAMLGDPCQEYALGEAGVRNFDVIVVLGPEDTGNFEVCQMGEKIFGIRKTLCLVRNSRNMELFEKLGVSQAVNIPVIIAGTL